MTFILCFRQLCGRTAIALGRLPLDGWQSASQPATTTEPQAEIGSASFSYRGCDNPVLSCFPLNRKSDPVSDRSNRTLVRKKGSLRRSTSFTGAYRVLRIERRTRYIMPLIKNPFKSKGASQQAGGDSKDPLSPANIISDPQAISPRPSVTISRPPEPDYKLSSVSPEGTFIPPSPPEKTSFLSRFRNPSTASSGQHAEATKEDGSGFVIPRESFDGYRRSFDIRPSMDGLNDGRPSRSSLDLLTATTASTSPRKTASANSRLQPLTKTQPHETRSDKKENVVVPPLAKTITNGSAENDFEDVKLDEDTLTLRKKHFWQRSSNLSGALRKDRDEANELRAFAIPREQNTRKSQDVDLGKDKTLAANSTEIRHTTDKTDKTHAVPATESDAAGAAKST